MTTRVEPATIHQKGTIVEFLDLYVHELRNLLGIDVKEHDIVAFSDLDQYWELEDHHPFLVYVDKKCIGFALVNKKTKLLSGAYAFKEYFLLKRYRGKGIGKAAALDILARFPGEWEMSELEKDTALIHFWRNFIRECVNDNYSEQYLNGRYIQTFSTDDMVHHT